MYAYIGRMSVTDSDGGLTVLDVTKPSSPALVQTVDSVVMKDSSWTNEKIYVKDSCLYVLNSNLQRLELYVINEEDGTIPSSPKWRSEEGYNPGTIKVIGNLMFVSAVSANSRDLTRDSLNIYDISDASDPVKLTTDTPILPAMENLGKADWEVTEQIATFSISAVDMGNGRYRVFGTNRAKFGDVVGNQYFLSIRDITISGNTYTVETVYEGQPSGTVFETVGNSVYDIDALNENIIAVAEGISGNGVRSLELIDFSNPQLPVKVTDNGADNTAVGIFTEGNTILLSTQEPRIYAYTYAGNTLTKEKEIKPKGTPYQTGVYGGFLYTSCNTAFEMYEYSNSISIDMGITEDIVLIITGTVNGFPPETDKVIVTVDGKQYTAKASGNRFSAALEGLAD